MSLTEVAARLDPRRFAQVHRSRIANLEAVLLLRPHDDRRLLIVLSNGEEIVASRSASETHRTMAR
jgi:two-component system LytT family response regulator